ncbi:MAG: hypothetical protein LC789_07410 [Actinobacteria bacterium]|nr:hypothetical protein [Actinomycetota bacterium]MCA1721689.1 hypothetical protein [Actinomycetota bacterium]
MLVSSYHYLEGPLIALAALGVLILICRWVFSTDHRVAPPAAAGAAKERPDYGLLEPVTVVRTREDAEMLREVLRTAGIRGTVTDTDGAYAVLVFRPDAGRARVLVRSP